MRNDESDPTAGLTSHIAGPVAVITLDRPENRNAQSPAMWAALAGIGQTLPEDVRVVVIRATGPSFSSGLDRQLFAAGAAPAGDSQSTLEGLGRLPAADLERTLTGYQEAFGWLRRDDLVSVAAVQGHAVGAGFQLALACDLRILTDDARLAMRETSLGLVPDLGGTHPLVEAIGYSRALEICVTGRWVYAEEARQLGLATLVVPGADLDDAVDDLVGALLEPDHGAVTATKALLKSAGSSSYEEQLAAERAGQAARLRQLVNRSAGKISG